MESNARTNIMSGALAVIASNIAREDADPIALALAWDADPRDSREDVSDAEYFRILGRMRDHLIAFPRVAGGAALVRDLLRSHLVADVLSFDLESGRVAVALAFPIVRRMDGRNVRVSRVSFAIESGRMVVRNLDDGGSVLDSREPTSVLEWLRG